VLLATGVFRFHTPVAVAAATLAAALFNPVRRRVQRLVDRRFNRTRYDADKTVTAFAARLQDAVDLDSVREDLTGVVHQAMEPAHLSVWVSRRRLRALRQFQLNPAQHTEPIQYRREQPARISGLLYDIRKNRPDFGLHRPAVTCRACLQTPLDGLVEIPDG
jgi:hypothetical protein